MQNEIIRRAKSPTPKFFKKIIKIGLTVGAIGGALMVPEVASLLPPIISKYAGYALTIGIVSTTISGLTVDNSKTTPFTPNKK